MSIVPLYGHTRLRRHLAQTAARDSLPASLLIHGPRGIGKQRLALWLGQLLLCAGAPPKPCGSCPHCRYAAKLTHPDLHWFFPRPRLADSDAKSQDVLDDYIDAVAERAARSGLYAPPPGTDALYVATIRAVVHLAALTPTLAGRKVFVIGDADRMVSQEGADAAANAFLKLLEEPPADTTLILTTSEPAALLPTVRSRLVAWRATPLSDDDVRAFLDDPLVAAMLDRTSAAPHSAEERLRAAAGAPGSLLGGSHAEAAGAARDLLAALSNGDADWARALMRLGGSRARGFFTDVLHALIIELHQRLYTATLNADTLRARAAARAIDAVEETRSRAAGNLSPQLLAAVLAPPLAEVLR